MRVRQFTQDDGHIFCTQDQLVEETKAFCALLDLVYRDLGFADYQVKLATRPDERIGSGRGMGSGRSGPRAGAQGNRARL